MEITFGEHSTEYMLDVFNYSENADGLLLDADNEIVTDSRGNTVPVSNIGAFINLGDDSDFSLSENKQVLHKGEVITSQDGTQTENAFVPVDNTTAVLRDDCSSLIKYSKYIQNK